MKLKLPLRLGRHEDKVSIKTGGVVKLKLPSRLGRHEDKVSTKTGGVVKINLPQRWGESRVRVPAGAAREFSSPASTFCADSYFRIHSTPMLLQ